jgi:predicted membrane protein
VFMKEKIFTYSNARSSLFILVFPIILYSIFSILFIFVVPGKASWFFISSLIIMLAVEMFLWFNARREKNKIVDMKRTELLKLSRCFLDFEMIEMQIKEGNLKEECRDIHLKRHKEINKRIIDRLETIELEKTDFISYLRKDLAAVMDRHRYDVDSILREIGSLERSLQIDLDSKIRLDEINQRYKENKDESDRRYEESMKEIRERYQKTS